VVAGLYGTVSRAALAAAESSSGAVTTVITNLTQAPAVGQALSVATGANAAALAGAARAGGQLYTASIPTALVDQLLRVGVAFQYTTEMNGVVGTEIRFTAAASEYIAKYFK
jgi:hypothetical protein